MVKNLPAMQEIWLRCLGWEDPLEKVMATHSSILGWRIPWTEALGSYSPSGCKGLHTTEQLTHTPSPLFIHWWTLRLLPCLGYCKERCHECWEYIYLFKLVFLFSSVIYPGVELMDHMVVLFLGFWGTSILFSIVAAPVYIPTNSVRVPFFYIFISICYLWCFWWQLFWQVWGGTSLWFWFAFLWRLVILSLFSCAC